MATLNTNLIEVTFNKSASFSTQANVLGYGTIKNNGIGIFYTVYLSDKTTSGIVVSLPTRKKLDGTYDNQAYFLTKEIKDYYESLVLKEIKAKGITVQPSKQLQTKVIIDPSSDYLTSDVESVNTDLPF